MESYTIKKFLEKNISEVVGASFFIFLIFLGYFTMVKKNITVVSEPRYLPVILQSAESLKIGSAVTLLGVPVGIIGSLHYVLLDLEGQPVLIDRKNRKFIKPDQKLRAVQGQYVVAVLDITRNVEVYNNYSIVTQYPSLFSVKTVDIRPGRKQDAEDPMNVRYLSLQEVLNLRTKKEMPQVLPGEVVLHAENFGDPLFLLTEIIHENQKQIRTIVSNMAEITDKLNRGDGNLAMLINKRGLEREALDVLIQASVLSHELEEGYESYRETNSLIETFKTLFGIIF
ncbi:MAG: hypothetical protein OEZ34_13380 [Spirochaetia bacterium]|nr:hypothetical protein [Spirochaetia bacterium]